jgi:hypothetical protein
VVASCTPFLHVQTFLRACEHSRAGIVGAQA